MPADEANVKKRFSIIEIGRVLGIPISCLQPSQPDDGREPCTNGPIQAYYDEGEIIVQDGNHRFWNLFRRGPGKRSIQVRRVESPIDHIKWEE